MKNLVGIDARVCQRIVLLLRHREHEPVGDHGTFPGGRKFCQVSLPGLGDAMFALRIGKLRRRGAGAVRIHSDAVVQESAGVDLPEGFLRSIVGEMSEFLSDLLSHIGSLAKRKLSGGMFRQDIPSRGNLGPWTYGQRSVRFSYEGFEELNRVIDLLFHTLQHSEM